MRLPHFEYLAPGTVEEACSFLAAHQPGAFVLAGGTDLLVKMKTRKVVPRYLVNLKTISGLDSIAYTQGDGLRIGALATMQALKNSSAIQRQCRILAQACAMESSVQVRNLATLGGNIANASPAADAPLALVAADATVVLASVSGEREILLQDFFTGPGTTILFPGELIKEAHVPPSAPGTGVAFLKHALRQTDIAIVAAAVAITLDTDKKVCIKARIGLGSVAPTILRASSAEALLVGKAVNEELADAAAREAARQSRPIRDIRGSAEYREKSVFEITRKAILQAVHDARTGGF
jgi:carbon-monoxide dehydrogenase medium subunit